MNLPTDGLTGPVDSRITNELTMGMKIAAKGSDKLRWEMDDSAAKTSGLDAGPVLTTTDGKNTWTYLSKLNQYVVDTGSAPDSLIKISDLLPVYGAKLKDDAKLLREFPVAVPHQHFIHRQLHGLLGTRTMEALRP